MASSSSNSSSSRSSSRTSSTTGSESGLRRRNTWHSLGCGGSHRTGGSTSRSRSSRSRPRPGRCRAAARPRGRRPLLDPLHHQLGDAVATPQDDRLPQVVVDEADRDLAAVAGVDRPRARSPGPGRAARRGRIAGARTPRIRRAARSRSRWAAAPAPPAPIVASTRRTQVDTGVAGVGVRRNRQLRVEPQHEHVDGTGPRRSRVRGRGSRGCPRRPVADRALEVLPATVRGEVGHGHLDEQRRGGEGHRPVRAAEPSDRAGEDLAPLDPVTSASMCSTDPTGTGRRKSVSSRPVTAGLSSSQLSAPSDLVEGRREQPAVRQAGGALVVLGHLERAVHGRALRRRPPRCAARWVGSVAAAEAVARSGWG